MSERGFADTNDEKFKKSLVFRENNLINSDGNMYRSLIERGTIITCSSNIAFRKINVTQFESWKMHLDKDLIEAKHYHMIHQFN